MSLKNVINSLHNLSKYFEITVDKLIYDPIETRGGGGYSHIWAL